MRTRLFDSSIKPLFPTETKATETAEKENILSPAEHCKVLDMLSIFGTTEQLADFFDVHPGTAENLINGRPVVASVLYRVRRQIGPGKLYFLPRIKGVQ